jgi:DNA invertase Pin-like site-specific DNA recombinase
VNILYCRTSTLDQRTDRQRVNEKDFNLVVEDKCSGTVPFFERAGGQKIKKLLDKGQITELAILEIDRLGRDIRDILNTVHYFTERNVCIYFISQGIRTIDKNGKENIISQLLISILGVIASMERSFLIERQREGIRLAVARGAYKGRQTGSKEDVLKFLSKPKNGKALQYLKQGLTSQEAAKLAGVHPNTITKIKRVALKQQVA